MAKIKLTRKSYKRNIIVFGVMLFMGIALVSTGFATWVLSQNTQIEVNGQNVNVGVVSDNALKISISYFCFGLTIFRTARAQIKKKTEEIIPLLFLLLQLFLLHT